MRVDFLDLSRQVTDKIASGKFDDAESTLLNARAQAIELSDHDALLLIIGELMHVYCLKEPPDYDQATQCCFERERLDPTAQARVQTAMMYYWSMHNPAKAIEKLREALPMAHREQDAISEYQGLSLLGLALLDLGHESEASTVLEQISAMVVAKSRIVIGDETLFLERLSSRTAKEEERMKIRNIASTLWPACRDTAFSARLQALAGIAQ